MMLLEQCAVESLTGDLSKLSVGKLEEQEDIDNPEGGAEKTTEDKMMMKSIMIQ